MSLEVEVPLGVGASVEEHVHQHWSTIEEVLLHCVMEGFDIPLQKPSFPCPQIDPGELESAPPGKVTRYMEQLTVWQGYTESTLAWTRAVLDEKKNEMTIIAAQTRVMLRQQARSSGERTPSKDVMEDTILVNPRHQELMRESQMLNQKRELLDGHAKMIGRGLRMVSRTIELRKEAVGTGGRRYV